MNRWLANVDSMEPGWRHKLMENGGPVLPPLTGTRKGGALEGEGVCDDAAVQRGGWSSSSVVLILGLHVPGSRGGGVSMRTAEVGVLRRCEHALRQALHDAL